MIWTIIWFLVNFPTLFFKIVTELFFLWQELEGYSNSFLLIVIFSCKYTERWSNSFLIRYKFMGQSFCFEVKVSLLTLRSCIGWSARHFRSKFPIYKRSWNFYIVTTHSSHCERDQLHNFAHGYEWLVLFELWATEWGRQKILLISNLITHADFGLYFKRKWISSWCYV